MKLTAKNPPAPFPASTTMWNPSNGFSEIQHNKTKQNKKLANKNIPPQTQAIKFSISRKSQ